MSGSGSGGYTPSPRTSFDCETGTIITSLSSVNIEALPSHSVGDLLIVEIYKNTIVVVDNNGEILGSILHSNVNELKDCIELGNQYTARITSITETSCTVRIYRN